MEDVKNGMISEEALEEVAGGLSIDREKLKTGLKYAGVAVVGAGALAGVYGLGKSSGRSLRRSERDAAAATLREAADEFKAAQDYDEVRDTLERRNIGSQETPKNFPY